MIIYSIIIPHKNTPALLQRCLDSIPRRADVQIIVVDDNSDSRMVDFRNFPGKQDPFVDFIFGREEQGRRGAGYARNLGMERAKGRWLVFADADDFFNPCLDEAMDKYADADDCDLVLFNVNSVDSETEEDRDRGIQWNHLSERIKESGAVDDLRYQRYPAWGKFISRKLVDNNRIRFQERKVANDVYFTLLSDHYAKNIQISMLPVYCVTERADSLEMLDTFTRHREYFDAMCDIYNSVKPYKIETHLRETIYYWWRRMREKNALRASLYIGKLLAYCGITVVIRKITRFSCGFFSR